MGTRIPAEVFPPGELLKEELQARNWSQIEFAEIIGKDTRLVYEVINGKRVITPETASILGEALGTSAHVWMNLESQYQLSKVRDSNGSVSKKARLHTKFPVRDMVKRNWIKSAKSAEAIENQIFTFFGIGSIDQEIDFPRAAKKTAQGQTPIQQLAWLFRVREIAKTMFVNEFSAVSLIGSLADLSALTSAPEEARHAARILANCGVRLVFVEPLAGSRIDGVCFWLDDGPVIGMALHFDRIDNFWFVLRHEIEHVLKGHGKKSFYLDQDVDGADSISDEEVQANKAAADFCVPEVEMQDFFDRVSPYFYEQKVLLFAQQIGVHPGLVVGQLHRRLGRHDLLKKHQVKIRYLVIPSTATDGWGQQFLID